MKSNTYPEAWKNLKNYFLCPFYVGPKNRLKSKQRHRIPTILALKKRAGISYAKNMKMTLKVNIPVLAWEEDGVFVAQCPMLDIVSQGDSAEDARKNLAEAAGLFLGTCIEMGTFSQVLKECGFTPASTSDQDDSMDHLEVPLPFVASRHKHECHA